MPRYQSDDADHVSYLYQTDPEVWTAWKRTVPRDTPLYERLDRLLAYDRDHDIDHLVARDVDIDRETDGVALTALRIRRRCASGVQNARAEGADDAAEALTEIKQLADGMLQPD